jgi:hypothetical protein
VELSTGGSRVLLHNIVRRRRLRRTPSASVTTFISERLASDSLSTGVAVSVWGRNTVGVYIEGRKNQPNV